MSQVDLYELTDGTTTWRFTNASKDITYNLNTYTASAISRGVIESKQELARANLSVRIPLSYSLASTLLSTFSDQLLSLTIYTQRAASTSVSWKGRLVSLKPDDTDLAMIFESIFTSLRRAGLRARYQRQCRHALYSAGCTLSPATFAVAATLNTITGDVLDVPEAALQPDGYYLGGMLAAADGVLSFIVGHVGNLLSLQRVSSSLVTQLATDGPGTAITIYPGCDLSRATCIAKFNNLLNYGGFDWIPTKNPMGGSSIV